MLSLDAGRSVTHVNQALLRMFQPDGHDDANQILRGASLAEVFPAEVLEDFEPLLRRADRMGMTTSQMEMQLPRTSLNVAVTVATLRHQGERSGYVVVFEDLSDLLKAQKQAAWREVARRVAHEIKNPLTPIALSAERIQRHLDRATPSDPASLTVVRSCAETIASAVETVRRLVDEFSTLARFPVAHPQPTDINEIIENALSMFNGRLDGIQLHKLLASDLPKVMADSDAIKRAVANLVDNAAEVAAGLHGARDRNFNRAGRRAAKPSRSPSPIPATASPANSKRNFFCPISPPRNAAPASAWPSSAASSRTIAVRFAWKRIIPSAPASSSSFP